MKKKIIRTLNSMEFNSEKAYFEPLVVGIEILIKKPLKANNIYNEIGAKVNKTLNTVSFNIYTAKQVFFKNFEDHQFKYKDNKDPFAGIDYIPNDPKQFLIGLAQHVALLINKW